LNNHPAIDSPGERFLARRGIHLALVIAAVLGVSTVTLGFFVDDYVHILSIEGKVPMTTKYDLFAFATGEPGAIEKNMGFIPFPWFTDLNAKLHFFRPLSSATMVLDHALFGRNAVGYHLHSTLWYIAFVAACWLVFKRALPPLVAGVAIVLFALDFGHLFATAWWSNRNALVAAVPALFGLWAHMRWREDGWKPGLPISIVGYALGLLGGETALALFGYVGAYELFGRRDPLARRIGALVPGALVGVVYLINYKLGHFGTSGSGVYIDPTSDPLRYLLHAPERIFMLIGAQFFLVPVELPVGNQALFWPIVLVSVAATALVAWLAQHAWKELDEDVHRNLRWLVIGALLSCAPVLSTFASARLLLVPSIGAIALLAVILLHLRAHAPRGVLRALYIVLIVLHVGVAAVAWPGLSLAVARIDAVMRGTFARSEIDSPKVSEEILIVPVAPDPMLAMYTVILREYEGRPRAKAWLALSMAQCTHTLARTAENRIELTLVEGEYLKALFEQLVRDPKEAFHVGQRIELPQMTVEILGMGTIGPNRVAFEFPGDLDEAPYVFMLWKENRLARTTPPAVGDSIEIPRNLGIIDLNYLRNDQNL
jgi:hypothetical protein